MNRDESTSVYAVAVFILLGIVGVGLLMWIMPHYNLWSREMRGKAELAEAT